jgi:hypothetical protein
MFSHILVRDLLNARRHCHYEAAGHNSNVLLNVNTVYIYFVVAHERASSLTVNFMVPVPRGFVICLGGI